MTAAIPLDHDLRFGHGELATALVAGASAVVRLAAKNPLKFVVSRERGPCARVHAATFGGGLVAGDAVRMDLDVGAGSTLVFGTSAPGKVYRSDERASSQHLALRVGPDAACGVLPMPLACFAEARFLQRNEVDLDPAGNLVWAETLTSGRAARGERWAFHTFDSRLRLRVGGRLVLHESMRLQSTGAPIVKRFRTIDALATIVLAGPKVAALATDLHRRVSTLPANRDEHVRVAASAWPWGLVVRAAATEVERLAEAQHEWLGPALELLSGGDGWHGPW